MKTTSLLKPSAMGEVDIENDGVQMLLLRAWERGLPAAPALRWDAKFTLNQSSTVLEVSWTSRPAAYGAGYERASGPCCLRTGPAASSRLTETFSNRCRRHKASKITVKVYVFWTWEQKRWHLIMMKGLPRSAMKLGWRLIYRFNLRLMHLIWGLITA